MLGITRGLLGGDVDLAKTFTNILPQIIREVTHANHGPVLEALFHNLGKPRLEQPTFLALLR